MVGGSASDGTTANGGPDPSLAAYQRARRRTAELVSEPAVDPATPVTACPGWDVAALLAHLTGLAVDVVSGNTGRYGSRRWTAAQIEARAGRPVAQLLDEWAEAAEALGGAPLPGHLSGFGTVGNLVLIDLGVHEHDLRGALDRAEPDNETARHGLDAAVELLGQRLRPLQDEGRAPTVRLVARSRGSWSIGPARPTLTVEADPFELWRALSGRRSRQQVEQLAWSGDPGPVLDHWTLAPTPFAAEPLIY